MAEPEAPEELVWVSVAGRIASVKAVYLDYSDETDVDESTGLVRAVPRPLEAPMTVAAMATLRRIDEPEALTTEAEIGTWLLWFHYHQFGAPPFKGMDLPTFAAGVDTATVELQVLRRGSEVEELMDPKAPSSSPPPSPSETAPADSPTPG